VFWVDTPFAQRSLSTNDASVSDEVCSVESQIYTVKPGDSLVEIGHQFGSTLFWEAIYITNADLIDKPELIYPGQQFEIPRKMAHLDDPDRLYSVIDDPFCETKSLPLHAVDATQMYLYDLDQLKESAADSSPLAENETDTSRFGEASKTPLQAFRDAFEAVAETDKSSGENRQDLQQEKVQQQSEQQIMMELDGMILDETRSKVGRDFYDVFYSNWQSPPDATNFSISISEQPSPSLGTIIYVEVNDDETFRMRLQPRYDFIQQAGQYAVRQTYNHLQNNDYRLEIY